MNWILALVLTLAAGWLLASALTREIWPGAATRVLGPIALALLFGGGLGSIANFLAIAAGLGSAPSVWGLLGGLVLVCGAVWWRTTSAPLREPVAGKFPWTWALVAAFAVGCLLLGLDFFAASRGNPNGDWDASAIWNLRAKFLAGGPEVWRRALNSETGAFMTGASHPGYPLFLSSLIALQWAVNGGFVTEAPIATSLIVSASLLLCCWWRAQDGDLCRWGCWPAWSCWALSCSSGKVPCNTPICCKAWRSWLR